MIPGHQLIIKDSRLRSWILIFIHVILCCSNTACADGISLEGGQGFHHSSDSQVVFLCCRIDSPPLFGLDTFYNVALGAWNGPYDNHAFIVSKGFWTNLHGRSYISVEPGAAYVDRTTNNLGTHLQFAFRSALGIRAEKYDLSIGYRHFSNGKGIFRWTDTSNYGENFITLQIAYLL